MGKKICMLLTAWLLACVGLRAEGLVPQVNEQVELMSIAARLAGYQEYDSQGGGTYLADIQAHFKKLHKHPFIGYMKALRNSHHIGYDAVMSMAIRLVQNQGAFSLAEEEAATEGLDRRWEGVDMEKFLRLASRFYQDSRFDRFFADHQALYRRGLDCYSQEVLQDMHTDWYKKFYGKEQAEDFTVVVAFNNSHGNYGPSRQLKGHRREVFAIVTYAEDEQGAPAFNKGYLPTLVHEFNHSYVNYLLGLEDYAAQLERDGFFLYMSANWAMDQQAYGAWQTVVNESVVRAAVICYMIDNEVYPEVYIQNLVLAEIARGFRWTPQLVMCLRAYEAHRTQYPTLEAYYPQIIDFFKAYAAKEKEAIFKIWE